MIEQKCGQSGQSMTEYIIIMALVAVAGIAIYGLFGDAVRGQLGGTAEEQASQIGDVSVAAPNSAGPNATEGVSRFSNDTKH